MLAVLFYILVSLTSPADASPGQCCFVHPNYNGICVVDPAPGESCASILSYLNTAGTVGKSYCGNTIIRGGWQQVDCR